MNILVIFSLVVKLFGAVIEIGSQSLISQMWSVEVYGTYSFFISLAEGFYFLFFSGVIKFNNYYIPQQQNIKIFKRKLYSKYAIPVLAVGIVVSIFLHNSQLMCACIAGSVYFPAMDISSTMMSYGHYKTALIGEYCIGRIFLILFIIVSMSIPGRRIEYLYIAYTFQFIASILFYKICNRNSSFKQTNVVPLEKGAAKKYVVFQSTEIAHMIIMQTSVIVQYIFGGAYQTALISIVLVVRKLINFITGPTSKLYQPEFSKKYKSGDKKALSDVYAQITRIQLCFMMPVFTFLVARPDLILSIYNKSLIEYGTLIRATAIVFLFMIAFGPLANFLCMTGHEKSDTTSNWISVAVMYSTMAIFRDSVYFVVYGFCAQIIFSTIYKLIVYIKFMKVITMPVADYTKLFVIFAIAILIMMILPLNIFTSMTICVIQFILDFIIVVPKSELNDLLSKLKLKRR